MLVDADGGSGHRPPGPKISRRCRRQAAVSTPTATSARPQEATVNSRPAPRPAGRHFEDEGITFLQQALDQRDGHLEDRPLRTLVRRLSHWRAGHGRRRASSRNANRPVAWAGRDFAAATNPECASPARLRPASVAWVFPAVRSGGVWRRILPAPSFRSILAAGAVGGSATGAPSERRTDRLPPRRLPTPSVRGASAVRRYTSILFDHNELTIWSDPHQAGRPLPFSGL